MMKMVQTDKAPKPIGPYSQAIRAGEFLFLSGQIAADPSANIETQTDSVLKNIEAILVSQNLTKKSVVKTTIFLTDLTHFSKVNEVYTDFFGDHKPARSTVEVSKLPKGAAIEIEAIAAF
ncbi:MAG: Rid family detoxifying hydrolase [Deltaproteobacteria bacterium]|nr:Rid family detoxifying hydrolase [Deltaproteobacteria bacterium]